MHKKEDYGVSSKSSIPSGPYCYEIVGADSKTGRIKTVLCPYFSIDRTKPYQMNGHCSYLGYGDWDDNTGFGLLWDQVKECGVNEDL